MSNEHLESHSSDHAARASALAFFFFPEIVSYWIPQITALRSTYIHSHVTARPKRAKAGLLSFAYL